jgi:hypothetical protein
MPHVLEEALNTVERTSTCSFVPLDAVIVGSSEGVVIGGSSFGGWDCVVVMGDGEGVGVGFVQATSSANSPAMLIKV